MTEPVFAAESTRLLISALVIGLGAGMPVPTLVSTVEKGAGDTLQELSY